jgi:hypothetical protein
MANPNIDDTFKKFFEERTLAPKDNAWDRLQTLMPENEPIVKKNKRPMYWAVAATFIGFLMALVMWNQNSGINEQIVAISKENINSVKEVPAAKTQKQPDIDNTELLDAEEVLEIGDQLVVLQRNTSNKKSGNNLEDIQQEQPIEQSNAEIVSPEVVENDINTIKKDKPYTKINIDADILLKEVNQKLQERKPSSAIVSSSYRPDPSKLLEDAEIASERTTFQKLFKSLQNNSEILLANVVDRNYQK